MCQWEHGNAADTYLYIPQQNHCFTLAHKHKAFRNFVANISCIPIISCKNIWFIKFSMLAAPLICGKWLITILINTHNTISLISWKIAHFPAPYKLQLFHTGTKETQTNSTEDCCDHCSSLTT